MRDGRARKALALLTGLVLMAGLSACVESERAGAGGGGSGDTSADTFVFAASSDPATLDPAFANDGESFRVARQIFEGLVGTEPGTPDPAPGLAESWVSSEDGLTHTFTLHEGVKFHDGTDFNADAVCVNFNRWNNFTGVLQSESISYYWQKIMGGFATSDDPSLADGILAGCQANGPTEVTITLNRPFGAFIPALSLPAFAISSPAALEQYNADEVTGTGEAPQFGEYANAHPTGIGPFTFDICAAPFGTSFFFSWWLTKRAPDLAMVYGCLGLLALPLSFALFINWFGAVKGFLVFLVALGVAGVALRNAAQQGASGVEDAILAIPVFGPLYDRFLKPVTYFSVDSRIMFEEAVHGTVLKIVEGLLSAKGARALSPEEAKPQSRDVLR